MIQRNLAICVLSIDCETIRRESRIEMRLIGNQAIRDGLCGIEKVDRCGAIFGIRHQIAVFEHILRKRVLHTHGIYPYDRPCIIFIPIQCHFPEAAFQIGHGGLRCGIVDDIAYNKRQDEQQQVLLVF